MLDLKIEESNGTTGFVKSTGVHTVTLVRVGSQDRKLPSKAKALSITVQGTESEYADTIYDMLSKDMAPHYIKSDGTQAKLVGRILAPLCKIVGTDDTTVAPQPVEVKGGFKDMDTFIGLSGTGTIIKVAIQMQWDDYNKKMAPVLLAVFNEDGLSATELSKGITEPKQIDLYANLTDKVKEGTVASTGVSVSAIEEASDIF